MDIDSALSNESDDHSHGKDTIHSQTDSHKTKNIRKFYQPIIEGGVEYRFEDDPEKYKRLRK